MRIIFNRSISSGYGGLKVQLLQAKVDLEVMAINTALNTAQN